MRFLSLAAGLAFLAAPVAADEAPRLSIKDHRFEPQRIEIPAGVKVKLMVRNEDSSAEEFESFELNREKVVPAGQEIPIFIGPLAKGEYPFFGDFHQDTARGVLVAK
jgi:plastocyanin domain-containing protein